MTAWASTQDRTTSVTIPALSAGIATEVASQRPSAARRSPKSSLRVADPSRWRRRATWCSTVLADRNSRAPISR